MNGTRNDTMKTTLSSAIALTVFAAAGAHAQDDLQFPNTVKLGASAYTTHSSTNGVTGPGIPPGADAKTGNAGTLLLVYERHVHPHFGIELALGIPPTIKADATGSVAFLGEVLEADVVSPTLLFNYHFNEPGDALRPYVGIGINYTKFANIKTRYGWDVQISDSVGPAVQAGIDYAINRQWGIFASVAAIKVKSDLVATSGSVLQTTIDFKPVVYSIGVSYKF